jgi:hypothetical protein
VTYEEFELTALEILLDHYRQGADQRLNLVAAFETKGLIFPRNHTSQFSEAHKDHGKGGNMSDLYVDEAPESCWYFKLNREGAEFAQQLIKRANEIKEQRKSKTISGRLKRVPIGKALWDIAKIGLGAALGYFLAPSVNGSDMAAPRSLQSRVDTIVADCGYAGTTTYKASGPNEITMSLDMAAFERDGPEEGATAAAHSCVMQKLREIPNLSLGFIGNGPEK